MDEERITWVEHQARVMEQRATMAIDSIWQLMAAILGNRAQVLAPHHIPGAGMGKVEAMVDLKLWLNDLFVDDGKGESMGDDPMDADD